MAANIPAPIVTGGGGQRQGIGEAVLLTMASAAPGLLMRYLDQRQQSADQTAQGDASATVIGELARQGVLSPEFARATGASVQPGQTVQGVTTPSGMQTPTVSTQTHVNTAGIDRRQAPQLLSQMLGAQQQTAAIESSKAATATSRIQGQVAQDESARADELQPYRIQQLQEGILTEQANREYQKLQLELQRRQVAQGDEKLRLERQTAVDNREQLLTGMYSDQMRTFTGLAQLYASTGLSAADARARAATDVFRTTKPPTADEWVGSRQEAAATAVLTDQNGSPFASMQRAAFGDRPDVEFGTSVGLQPAAIEYINQQLTLNDGDATKTLAEAAAGLTLEGDARVQELARMTRYLSYKAGQPVTLPKEDKKGILQWMRQMLGGSGGEASGQPAGQREGGLFGISPEGEVPSLIQPSTGPAGGRSAPLMPSMR